MRKLYSKGRLLVMNFGKKAIEAKNKQLTSSNRRIRSKLGVMSFRIFLVLFVAVISCGSYAALGIFNGIIDSAPGIDTINVTPQGYSTTIYDAKGRITQKLVGQNANRIYVTIDEIPKCVQDAFVAIEDERFWTHNGIDVRGIFRAAAIALQNRDLSQGASTITQQLIKNTVFDGGAETSNLEKIQRKIQEQYLAIQLEDRIDKDMILEYYLNTINLGQNTLGVQAASLRYFGKNVSDLNVSEAAVIAGITQNPSTYNPIAHPDNNREKRAIVLDYMKTQEYIDESEYAAALEDNVYERIAEYNESYSSSSSATSISSYFNDALFDQVMNDLKEELGYTETQAYNALYRGGLTIYSTQDPAIQKICDEVTQDPAYFPANSEFQLSYQLSVITPDGEEHNYNEQTLKAYFLKKEPGFDIYFTDKKLAKKYVKKYRKHIVKKNVTVTGENLNYIIQPQVSFVLMNQKNGKVLALVGGRGGKTASRTLNRATNSLRQPGSTFKVLSTYLPAFDTAGMTLATCEIDEKYYYPGTKVQVHNWNGNSYKGSVPLRQGIRDSMNIVTVKTLEKVTPKVAYDYLVNLGITTLVDNRVSEDGKVFSDIQLPMALGGLTDGVTNLELTAAYAAIANNGVYTEPSLYTKILDHDGNVLIDKTPVTRQVIKDSTAYLLINAMEDVITKGTGTLAKFSQIDMPAAGKTGTTSSDIDLWFEGFTPYYTAGIWGGWDLNKDQDNTTYHKVIWKTIMEKVHEKKKLKKKEFKMPDSIVEATICTDCGKRAISEICSSYDAAKNEYFAKDTIPSDYCTCHTVVKPKPTKKPKRVNTSTPIPNTPATPQDSLTNPGDGGTITNPVTNPDTTVPDTTVPAPDSAGIVTQ
ncbi:MAG: hypothetical protein E7265_07035 [Lachnospiraceae bacterium]|nr:hypothetical protein [Lachnospiraceae bacterium]